MGLEAALEMCVGCVLLMHCCPQIVVERGLIFWRLGQMPDDGNAEALRLAVARVAAQAGVALH